MRKTIDFGKFTNDELWEIYKSVNIFEWNDLLGEKPKGFDDLPIYRHLWCPWSFFRKTKGDYTRPIWKLTRDLMPDDFFEKKEEEDRKFQIESWHEEYKKYLLSEKVLRARLGKRLFEHMIKQH